MNSDNHKIRKAALARAASAKHREYFYASKHTANNKPTPLIPTPQPRHRAEMSVNRAMKMMDVDKVKAANARELKKVTVSFKSLRKIDKNEVQKKHAFIRTNVLVKEKSNGEISSRLAADGSTQPEDSYNSTYAGTSDLDKLLCLLSAVLADSAHRGVVAKFGNFDIPGAFLTQVLTQFDTNGFQFLTKLPKDFYGDKDQLWEIIGAQYGLKQSNSIFTEAFRKILNTHGYSNTELAPHIYRKQCPDNPKNYLFINMHVDDGAFLSTSPTLTAELKEFLTAELGSAEGFPLTWEDTIDTYLAKHFTRNTDGSMQVDMAPYIAKFLKREGMDGLPGALTPALEDFFDAPTNITLFNKDIYQTTQGGLIFLSLLRTDIKMPVNHLSSFSSNPTQSHRDKQIQIMRYILAYPDCGPRFSGDPADFPNGAQLSADVDSSHASTSTCQDRGGILFFIGNNNAPFASYASTVPGISLNPCEGEYVMMSMAAKECVFWQQFLEGLGFHQILPTIIREDNLPAINLVTAPAVTRRSRHMLIRHHYIRWLHQQNMIRGVHLGTDDMKADFVTKVYAPRKFHYVKDKIFNKQRNAKYRY